MSGTGVLYIDPLEWIGEVIKQNNNNKIKELEGLVIYKYY